MRKFYTFCIRYNVTDPFPVTEHLLCCFAVHVADEGLSPQTVKAYLAAVRNTQLSLGLPDPRDQSSLAILKRVQAGICRSRASRPQTRKARLPITAVLMARIKTALESSANPEKCLLWAVCCSAFFGFFRLGELLPPSRSGVDPAGYLTWGDVAVDNQEKPTMVRFHLRRSKTDQFGRGADIVVGRTGRNLCPVTAVLHYISRSGEHSGPFFLTSQKLPLTKPEFVAEVRKVLETLGLPAESYAGHSFRIGAATTAALVGMEDSSIQLLGRWQSAAFLRYIRTPQDRLAALSTSLATQATPYHPGS